MASHGISERFFGGGTREIVHILRLASANYSAWTQTISQLIKLKVLGLQVIAAQLQMQAFRSAAGGSVTFSSGKNKLR